MQGGIQLQLHTNRCHMPTLPTLVGMPRMGASRRRTPSMVPRRMRFSFRRSCRQQQLEGACSQSITPRQPDSTTAAPAGRRSSRGGGQRAHLCGQALLGREVPLLQVLHIVLVLIGIRLQPAHTPGGGGKCRSYWSR